MSEEKELEKLAKAVIDADLEAMTKMIRELTNVGVDPIRMIQDGLAKGIREMGDRFGRGEAFLPDLVMGAEAMKAGIKYITPEIEKRELEIPTIGKFLIGTVEGDIHNIGKTIVSMMLEVEGFRVVDLGVDVRTSRFIEKVKELKPDILGLSALMTTSLDAQRRVIEALKSEGLRREVKVMIGGASVTEAWAKEIGADDYATDAISGAKKAKEKIEYGS